MIRCIPISKKLDKICTICYFRNIYIWPPSFAAAARTRTLIHGHTNARVHHSNEQYSQWLRICYFIFKEESVFRGCSRLFRTGTYRIGRDNTDTHTHRSHSQMQNGTRSRNAQWLSWHHKILAREIYIFVRYQP